MDPTSRAGGPSSGVGSAASNAAPSPDKILKEVMHKITQIVVRARIPAHVEVRGRQEEVLRVGEATRMTAGSGSLLTFLLAHRLSAWNQLEKNSHMNKW